MALRRTCEFIGETFGPVAPVIPFSDEREALALANDTHYGLAAYVYTRDVARAMRMFEGLNFGNHRHQRHQPGIRRRPLRRYERQWLRPRGSREGIVEYLETKVGGFSI